MLKKIIAGTGLLFIAALPLAAQTTQAEKDHPLEAPTEENPQYRERHRTKDHTGISKDPKFPAHNKKPGVVDTTRRDTAAPGAVPPVKKEEETAPPK